ncbi:AAA family ATPase [Marinomonas pollencensis]|uniref:AAA ATPase-like protein n=1 Tax=Marinomonas pollencensis TaxID=491954 RepID=A0A3E0DNC1_9GAMM|nr:AAA family ATPase [Marinomonas pollencensis]REG83639.1 AAA ATPase-like protein [Marinomonas pollencensis]
MKLISFKASKVHGYLDFDVSFRDDVNFFAGLNGSGKTTVLKLIVSMISPDIKEIRSIGFESATIILEEKNKKISIAYKKDKDKKTICLYLDIDGEFFSCLLNESDKIRLEHNEMEFADESNESASSVISKIRKITSPMFLSLDRRFIKTSQEKNKEDWWSSAFNSASSRERDRFQRKTGDTSIDEVLKLVSEEFRVARVRQSRAENTLRDKIILDSLSFTDASESAQLPNVDALALLKKKQSTIIDTLKNLELSIDGFETKFNDFFTKFENLAKAMDKEFKGNSKLTPEQQEDMVAWFVNQNQLNRINRIFELVEEYQYSKTTFYRKLDKLTNIINKFLSETEKKINIDQFGDISVYINNNKKNLSILSSGERQILIMFTHLILDKTLRSGIFIVDEPELSLHISWQDMYVSAVQEANSGLQLILATHSPAIIGGRNHMYVPLDGERK